MPLKRIAAGPSSAFCPPLRRPRWLYRQPEFTVEDSASVARLEIRQRSRSASLRSTSLPARSVLLASPALADDASVCRANLAAAASSRASVDLVVALGQLFLQTARCCSCCACMACLSSSSSAAISASVLVAFLAAALDSGSAPTAFGAACIGVLWRVGDNATPEVRNSDNTSAASFSHCLSLYCTFRISRKFGRTRYSESCVSSPRARSYERRVLRARTTQCEYPVTHRIEVSYVVDSPYCGYRTEVGRCWQLNQSYCDHERQSGLHICKKITASLASWLVKRKSEMKAHFGAAMLV